MRVLVVAEGRDAAERLVDQVHDWCEQVHVVQPWELAAMSAATLAGYAAVVSDPCCCAGPARVP